MGPPTQLGQFPWWSLTGPQIVGGYPSWNITESILEGFKKGMLKQKSLNMIQALQKKPDEDPSEFLKRISQAYRKHTNADP